MPTPCNALVSWLVVAFSILTTVVIAVWAWRAGRAFYLMNLNEKHFDGYYGSDAVRQSLNQIARCLGRNYYDRDKVIESLVDVCAQKDPDVISRLGADLSRINAEIARVWAVRHEAEATAKLMGFGQLVDEIHERGIPRQEPAVT